MKRLWILLLLGGVGGWYVWRHYELKGLETFLAPLGGLSTKQTDAGGLLPPVPPGRRTILVASFNANPLDGAKLTHPARSAALVQLLRRFDIVALQNIQLDAPGQLLHLRDQVNAAGRYYEVALGPEAFSERGKPTSAIFYDRAMIEIDLGSVYWVEDSQGRLRHRPLVATFRARGPHPSQAFTFTLVSVYIPADRVQEELDLIDEVYRTVRKNGRGEDDLLLVGTLHADLDRLNQWLQTLRLTWAIGSSSALPGEKMLVADNILFHAQATVEYTGRAGMIDLVRELGLSVQEAMELSDHWPVWAEFSVYEGGEPGGLASRPGDRLQ